MQDMQERAVQVIKDKYKLDYDAVIYENVDVFDFVAYSDGRLRFVIVRTFTDKGEFFNAIDDNPISQETFEASIVDFLLVADAVKDASLELDIADLLRTSDDKAMLRIKSNMKFY